jgi:hypothetical protein
MYKTFLSTCLDVNKSATAGNTVALQAKRSHISLNASQQSTATAGGTIGGATNLSTQILNARSESLKNDSGFSTATANLSLIVAAGFNKGEIHVFDLFKNDASVFYNNSVSRFCLVFYS